MIDQSDGGASASALLPYRRDERLRYVPSETRGLSRARNECFARAKASVLAFTDDDCRVDADFVESVTRFFESRPDIALAFGRVTAPEELHAKGYVATFEPNEVTYERSFPSPMEQWGIGANMAVRRAAFERAGAFDAALGAGAPIPAGEELDFVIRVIGAGHRVATTGAFSVTHLGVREHEAARKLFLGYVEGAGAAYVKNVRLRTPGATGLFLKWFVGSNREVVRALVTGRRPLGVGLVLAGLRGGKKVLSRP